MNKRAKRVSLVITSMFVLASANDLQAMNNGSNEQNADFIVGYFFPLSVEEHAAILNSSGGQNYNCSNLDVTPIYSKYPLVVLLHTADLLSTYIPTRHKEEEEHIEEEKIECPPEHTSVEKPWVMDSEDM